jgi:hypothetical protein
MTSVQRRLNSTGRIRITRSTVDIAIEQPLGMNAVTTARATSRMDGLGVPGNSSVAIEAYYRTSSMRFPCGTINNLNVPERMAARSASSVSAADFPICCHDPIPRFSSIGAGTSAAAPSRRSRRQHRSPQLHRRPRTGICPTTIPQKRNDDVASSRSADQAARAGRSASGAPRNRRASRARDGSETG